MNDMTSVTLEEVQIAFRNFAGNEGKYNREGQRNFCVFLEEDVAEAMADDGWNIRRLKPREDDEDAGPPQAYLQVAVNYASRRPPRVVLITHRGKTPLTEDMISMLDWAEIKQADLILNPYEWEVNGKTGVKAYLQSLFVTIVEDELEQKYIDVPDSASNTLPVAEED